VSTTAAENATRVDAAQLFARLIANETAETIAASAMKGARFMLLDTLGCAIAGNGALGVSEARELVMGWGGHPSSRIWGTAMAVPPPEAAFANSVSGHALDYDDQHPGICHTGVSVVPAALAIAESEHVSDLRAVLAAMVLGAEITDRLATAVTVGPGSTGWLLSPLCGVFGAAAVSAKLMGLDEEQILHALGFAYVQASGNGQSTLDGAVAKRMQPAFASRAGVFAAFLAARGLTGPTQSLEGLRGFFTVYHRGVYNESALRDRLGEWWLIEGATYKPYPCCAWTHAALECGFALRERNVNAEDVRSVAIDVNAQAYQSTGTPLPRRYRPQTEVDAQFSIPYTFGVAFTTGAVGLSDFETEALRRPAVLATAGKVVVSANPDLAGQEARDVSPARAVATLTDGTTVEVVVRAPLGRGDRTLTEAQLLSKFTECCEYGGRSRHFADQLAAAILEGESMQALLDLLGAPDALATQ
jgi:2-methylcitrate dehydratase PrpD